MGFYCPYCGTYLNDTDQVCPACGRQLSVQPQSTNSYQQNEQTQRWEEDPYQQTILLDDYYRQQQQNVQQSWDSQPQPNMQQSWDSQPQPNVQQSWNSQPQPNVQQSWDSQPQPNMQQSWDSQPQPNMQQVGWTGQQPPQPEPRMKWFKFVIWVQLFLSALVAAGNAVLLITGYVYGDDVTRALVYAYYPSLKTIDFGCGIAYAMLAVIAIIVRFRLSGFKKNGPSLYIFYLVLEVLMSLAYTGLVIYAIQTFTVDISFISSMASIGGSIVLILLSIVYFRKRKHLFCK